MFFPPIGPGQGAGDCTCWSSAYYYSTFLQCHDEGLNASIGDTDAICAVRFLFGLIAQGHWGAECTEHAMARLSAVGCASSTLHPYGADWNWPDIQRWPTEAAWIQALDNRPGQLVKIRADSQALIDVIKQRMANGTCVVTRGDFALTNYSSYGVDGTGDGIDNHVMYTRVGSSFLVHSVCICAYDDTASYYDDRYPPEENPRYGAFLIANSEGQDWGWYNTTGEGGGGTRGFLWVAYEMFIEGELGWYTEYPGGDYCSDNAPYPEVYCHDDRPRYQPQLYAVTGINHPDRHRVELRGGIGSTSSPEFLGPEVLESTPTTTYTLAVDDTKRIAVDLTDGLDLLLPDTPKQVFVLWSADSSASGSGTMTSAEFFYDPEGHGFFRSVASSDPPLTVTPGNTVYATVMIETAPSYVYVDASNTTAPWDGTAENPYQTVQDGIDNAIAGDTVRVLPGTYNEAIVLTSNVAVIGSGPHVTTIDSGNTAETVYANGIANGLIEGFTIISGADYFALRSADSTLTVRDCVTTASKSGFGAALSGSLRLVNCLAAGNDRAGAWDSGTAELLIDNCTIVNNTLFGVGHWGTEKVLVRDSIVWNNGDDLAGAIADYTAVYCDIGDGDFAGAYGNISADPLFVAGSYHSFYLSQTAAGQGSDSPCLDAGSYAPTALGLDGGTTRTDDAPDTSQVDMGYHTWPELEITSIGRGSDDVTITWNARPGVSYIVDWSTNRVAWNDVPVGEQGFWTDTNAASYMEKYYRVREE